jgi:hypothetical protein
MGAILFQIQMHWIDTKIKGYPLVTRLGGPQSRSGIVIVVIIIIIIIIIIINSVRVYLHADLTAQRPITKLARVHRNTQK